MQASLAALMLRSSRPHPYINLLTFTSRAGLVETSTNLASVRCDQSASASQAGASIVCCTRSSLSSALEAVRDRIEKVELPESALWLTPGGFS